MLAPIPLVRPEPEQAASHLPHPRMLLMGHPLNSCRAAAAVAQPMLSVCLSVCVSECNR